MLVANASKADPSEKYGTKPVAEQFFRLFELKSIQTSSDFIAYFEPDTLPIRAMWLDRSVKKQSIIQFLSPVFFFVNVVIEVRSYFFLHQKVVRIN